MSNTDTKLPIVYGMLCVVISSSHKLLLLKRSPTKTIFPNKWSVIGAYPFQECGNMGEVAIKELKEETGLQGTILVGGQEMVKSGNLGGKDVELHVFPFLVGTGKDGVSLNEEHTEYKWIKLEELTEYDLAPGIVEAISAVETKEHLSK